VRNPEEEYLCMCVTRCPECRELLHEAIRLQEGEQITCVHCGARLEVITLVPMELDWVYAEPYQAPEEIEESELDESTRIQ
jgi:hypothetical protein